MPHTFRTKARRWVYKWIPAWLKRRDFEIFTSVLCLSVGIPVVFGGLSAGESPRALPQTVEYIWSLNLVIGPILVLVGIYMSNRRTYQEMPAESLVWYRVEALGLTILAYVGYIFVLAIIMANGTSTLTATALILALALTCHLREVTIQLDIADFKLAVGVRADERD